MITARDHSIDLLTPYFQSAKNSSRAVWLWHVTMDTELMCLWQQVGQKSNRRETCCLHNKLPVCHFNICLQQAFQAWLYRNLNPLQAAILEVLVDEDDFDWVRNKIKLSNIKKNEMQM